MVHQKNPGKAISFVLTATEEKLYGNKKMEYSSTVV